MQSLSSPASLQPSPVGYAPFRDERAPYETHGTSLVRYLARRTAKTRLLLPLADLLGPASTTPGADEPADLPDTAACLAVFGQFVLAAATSFGRGYRQPSFDETGSKVAERDPETGAAIVARLDGRGPGSRLRLSVAADLTGIGRLEAAEEITGTTVGLHGLGMPAPSRFAFETAAPLPPWSATAMGVITTELGPTLGGFVVRGHAELELADSAGNRGEARLARDGTALITIIGVGGTLSRRVRIA